MGNFLLVGGVGVATHPAHLVEDMPGDDADPPTKSQPCIVTLGILLLVGGGACPPRPPSGRRARG